MSQFTISEVARQVGLRASAIRYYEEIGLLPPPQRMSGQRRYDAAGIYRLAVLQRARKLGFTLEEIRELFFGFRAAPRASERWQAISERKLAELGALIGEMEAMRDLLRQMMRRCHCETLEQCGKGIVDSGTLAATVAALAAAPRRSNSRNR